MADISQTASYDSRSHIERLRRKQLWDIAKANGIPFKAGAPKTDMVKLLEGAGVNVLDPANGVQWKQVTGKDENGHAHTELYPVVPENITSRQNIDYASEIEKRAQAAEQAEARAEEAETSVEMLQRELAALKELIVKPPEAFPLDKMLPWQLKQIMEERGIPHRTGMKKDEMLKALGVE